MRRTHDPGGSVHIHADVLRRDRERLPTVNAHPHPNRDALWPVGRGERLLSLRRGGDRVSGARERHEQRVPFLVHLVAVVRLERLPQQATVQVQNFRVALRPQSLEQPRRALYVTEHQGHRPRRLRGHQTTIRRTRAPSKTRKRRTRR